MGEGQKHEAHFVLAKEFFEQSLLRVLENYYLISITHGHKVRSHHSFVTKLIPNIDKVTNLLSDKSRWTYENLSTNPREYREFIERFECITTLDRTARNLIPPLFRIVIEISSKWIDSDISKFRNLAHSPDRLSDRGFFESIVSSLSKSNSDLDSLAEKMTIPNNWEQQRALEEAIDSVRKIAREIAPIHHDKDVSRQTVGELLGRFCEATWATY